MHKKSAKVPETQTPRKPMIYKMEMPFTYSSILCVFSAFNNALCTFKNGDLYIYK